MFHLSEVNTTMVEPAVAHAFSGSKSLNLFLYRADAFFPLWGKNKDKSVRHFKKNILKQVVNDE